MRVMSTGRSGRHRGASVFLKALALWLVLSPLLLGLSGVLPEGIGFASAAPDARAAADPCDIENPAFTSAPDGCEDYLGGAHATHCHCSVAVLKTSATRSDGHLVVFHSAVDGPAESASLDTPTRPPRRIA